jgi:hypothetical protein
MPPGLLLHWMAGKHTLPRQTLNSDRMELEKFARFAGAYKRFEGRGHICPWTLHRAPLGEPIKPRRLRPPADLTLGQKSGMD